MQTFCHYLEKIITITSYPCRLLNVLFFITAKAKFESTFQLSYISIVYLSSVLRWWAVDTQYRNLV